MSRTIPLPRASRLAAWLCPALLFPSLVLAEHSNDTATLRCMATRPDAAADAELVTIDLPDALRGQWQHRVLAAWSNIFMTEVTLGQVRALCTQALGTQPGKAHLFAVRAVGAHAQDPTAYEIWHRGDRYSDAPIERIVSFGDSLTDTGNMYLGSRQVLSLSPVGTSLPSEAWFAGRFSNGPTWVEYLAERNDLPLNNWAVGGAQTRDKATVPGLPFMAIHGLREQIDRFFEHTGKLTGYDVSRTLFTVLAAGNDFVNDDRNGPEIIQQQEDDLRRLAAGGARKILVMNLPDVTTAPVFRLGRDDAATVLGRIEYYNAHIGDVVTRVAAATGAQISLINVRASFEYLLEQKEAFGFTNATESCLAIDTDSALNYLRSPVRRAHCDPSTFVFWDTLHPTTRVHELMSGWVTKGAPLQWGLR